MKSIFYKIILAVVTFIVGIFCAWSFGILKEMAEILQKGIPVNPDSIVEKSRLRENEVIKLHDENQRFIPIPRICAYGSSQSYETNDGYQVSTGAWETSQKDFQKQIRQAKKIIENARFAKKLNGEKGLRAVLKNVDEDGNKYYEILWYGKGKIYYIDAPTLEIALEFEKSNAYAY